MDCFLILLFCGEVEFMLYNKNVFSVFFWATFDEGLITYSLMGNCGPCTDIEMKSPLYPLVMKHSS